MAVKDKIAGVENYKIQLLKYTEGEKWYSVFIMHTNRLGKNINFCLARTKNSIKRKFIIFEKN